MNRTNRDVLFFYATVKEVAQREFKTVLPNEINIFLINIRRLLLATNMDYKYLINNWYRCHSEMEFIAVKTFQR